MLCAYYQTYIEKREDLRAQFFSEDGTPREFTLADGQKIKADVETYPPGVLIVDSGGGQQGWFYRMVSEAGYDRGELFSSENVSAFWRQIPAEHLVDYRSIVLPGGGAGTTDLSATSAGARINTEDAAWVYMPWTYRNDVCFYLCAVCNPKQRGGVVNEKD